MTNGNAAMAARAFLLASCIALLGGCTLLRLGYGQFDTYAVWTANDYFDLTPEQRDQFSRRFVRIHDWHRYEQLPDYVAFLETTRTRLQNGIKRDDVLWVTEGVKNRYRAIMQRGADDAAAMLMTVTPAQLESLKKQWERDNRRFARDYRIHDGAQAQREARFKRALSRITDWTGSLSHEQETKIAGIVSEWPLLHPLRYEDRVRRQREFLQLMSQRGDARRFAERLRHWLGHWEEGRDPEYARLYDDWERRQADLYVAVAGMLTPEQRATALRRIQGYIDDFSRLARRPETQAATSR